MEDLLEMTSIISELENKLELISKAHFDELEQLFFGKSVATSVDAGVKALESNESGKNSSETPQQTKKRPKRLTALSESEADGEEPSNMDETSAVTSQRQSARMSNSQLLAAAQEDDPEERQLNTTASLMPPPPPPIITTAADTTTNPADTSRSSGRPQRAAKIRSEKSLKEPALNSKLRQPDPEVAVKVKIESQQRPSQFSKSTAVAPAAAPEKPQPVLEPEPKPRTSQEKLRSLRIEVKREKVSLDTNSTVTLEATRTIVETSTTSNTSTAPAKKTRKKKEPHKPIKVERFSDLDKEQPVSARTRQGSTGSQESQARSQRSVYEDAVEGELKAANATVTISQSKALGEATFNGPADEHLPGNSTFQVESNVSKETSMQTAREGSMRENSLMTEDDSVEEPIRPATKQAGHKLPLTLKGMKMPARTHELFNPLLQSPVKMRVEAFENAANAQGSTRPKRNKETSASSSSTTPLIGRLQAPTLGRFLTPTQSTSSLPINSAQPKKAPMSASKAAPLMKTATGTNLKSTNSGSTKTLSRENSGDDFRKGLHQLAEEKKKQRELKHQQAAALRETKERERAERLAKLTKEREEKRLKKLQKEKMEERKRQEMEELQRKMAQQDEIERNKKALIKEKEREHMLQMKAQAANSAKAKKMMPPPPKSAYTFAMLHEDDSTDDESKISYKRPAVPTWSRTHVRGPAIVMQNNLPITTIDSFFSVAASTPDLKLIFPDIDPSHLRRNSSVLWSTPPRYSELPKY
ncbi:Incenp [Drosophila busckii]|uniref:Incenp n=1 Tax=Drosophila busckii TaxID=30019 RepID=A0A0M5J741_DROBS|nr:mucin-5AC [Drosophila busckii]ALC41224.1 Incenp [Drosophila busckii]